MEIYLIAGHFKIQSLAKPYTHITLVIEHTYEYVHLPKTQNTRMESLNPCDECEKNFCSHTIEKRMK